MNASAFYGIDPVTLIEQLAPGLEDRGNLTLTLRHLAQTALRVFAADLCALQMFHPFTGERIVGFALASDHEVLLAPELEKLLRVLQKQDLVLVARADEYPTDYTVLTQEKLVQSFVSFALRVRPGASPVGVLYLAFHQPLTFYPADYDLIQIFARQTCFVLQDTWLLHCYREVARIGQEINQDLSTPEALFQKLRAMVPNILNSTHALLFSINSRTTGEQSLYLVDEGIYQYIVNRPFSGVARYVFETMQSVIIHHWSTEEQTLPFHIMSIAGTLRKESCIFVPMILRDFPIGILSIQHPQPEIYTEEDRILLQMLANQIALALTNLQTFASASQRHTYELEVVQKIDQEISRMLELTPVLETLLQRAAEHVEADSGSILLVDEHNKTLKVQAVWGAYGEQRKRGEKSLPNPGGIAGWVSQHQQTVRIGNTHTCQPWCSLYLQISPETISEIDVPLLVNQKAIGILNLESNKEEAFSQESQVFLETLATQATLAITRAQDYEHKKRMANEQRVLNEISKEIARQLDLNSVFDRILMRALGLTKSQNGILMLYKPEQGILWMATERGVLPEKRGKSHYLDEGVVGYVARTKKPLNVDPSKSPWNELYLDYIPDTRSELAVPILAGEKLLGVLNIESAQEHAFDADDLHLLQGLADLAAVALRNAELYDQAEQQALYFRLLYQAGRELSTISEPKQLEQGYEIIARLVEEQSKSCVILRRYEEATDELVLKKVTCHLPQQIFLPRINSHEGLNGYVTRERRSKNIDDISNPALLPPGVDVALMPQSGLRSLLVIPIQFKERYYGTLGLSHEEAGYFRAMNIQFYEGLAQQLASAIYRLEVVQAQQDAEKLSLIGESAMNVTHFLANQLGLVESYVGYVRRRTADQLGQDDAVQSKLDNITTAVRKVLQWGLELKEHLITMHTTEIDDPLSIAPTTLFSRVWEVCPRPEQVRLQVEIHADVQEMYMSEKMVGDILRNLIKNALEAMEQGGTLTLRTYYVGNQVALEVEDTGTGIPPGQTEHIFDLFHSTKKSTGYGLWSAKRNARRMGGNLRVRNVAHGRGAVFTLFLPRNTREGATPDSPSSSTNTGSAERKK